ncbi:MAG: hypothetical protein K2K97_07870 [Muribaculaceae bacterium]|nr:hypothetical protein [Muribaculaceae bacterium]
MLPKLNFKDALSAYCAEVTTLHILTQGSANSYRSYLNALENANGQQTIAWIKDNVAKNKELADFIVSSKQTFNHFITANPVAIAAKNQSKLKSAFLSFSLYIFSFFNADADQLWGVVIDDFKLAQLIAKTAIFADLSVVNQVIAGRIGRQENIGKGNQYASWDCMSSIRDMRNKGQTINGLYRDDNTRANHAIKRAVLCSLEWGKYADITYFRGFEACHIYDLVQDPRFYTSVKNLVLVPRALAALTDHNSYVQHVLKRRVYELFNFTAAGPVPPIPKDYQKIIWR